MARSTMADLIVQLRGMTHAGQEDYTIVGQEYWTDNQLQQILDRHRVHLDRYMLAKIPIASPGGAVTYKEHRIQGYENFEQTDGGSAVFFLEDAAGADFGTALWSADYNAGIVTFNQDTGGTVIYVTGRSYDLNGAAAEVWRQKTGHFAATTDSFDFSTDNMSVKRSQRVQQARDMAGYYSGLARPKVTTLFRSDVDAGALS